MKEQIFNFLKKEYPDFDFDVSYPPDGFGDYSTNLAFLLSKKTGGRPEDVAAEIVEKLKSKFSSEFEKIETAKNGFINLYLSGDFLKERLKKAANDKKFGFNETMKGKTVMIEYTDPNPFKLFHIGHLMSNTIGEAIAGLYEALGAKVIRVTWQGDVGMHIARAVLGWKILINNGIKHSTEWSLSKKMEYLGYCYALGAADSFSWQMIDGQGVDGQKLINERNRRVESRELDEINLAIYNKKDGKNFDLYKLGRGWSLDYFEEIYKRLGSKFNHYFFESELGQKGLEIVRQHPEVFEESDGAIVFSGEKYGLHTRVFINSSGLPVYESKELGLNKEKFNLYNPDLSIIITGNEINDYFKVLLKVMELTMPEVAQKTKHIGHGMMRLPTGKISSRTGDVITADSLIEEVKNRLPGSDAKIKESIAVGAIKYFILKQSPGHDIVFDFEKSVSIKGDAAPYLQYTYARLSGIKNKAGKAVKGNLSVLEKDTEISLMKKLIKFPEVVAMAAESNLPNILALYLYELANLANRFYETSQVLSEEDGKIKNARLALVGLTASVLEKGLGLLGIKAPERI